MSRLLMNVVLLKHGYPLLNIACEHRSSYYTALERAQTKQQDAIFVQWFFKRYAKECRRYAGNK
jgi:Fic family protein